MNFNLILPQKIIFGVGTVTKIGEEAKGLGAEKALIVTSQGMLQRESLKQVIHSLEEHEAGVEVFSEVIPEPPIENVDNCVAFAKENRCNLVIGLGGGSVMDVAKKVAMDLELLKIMLPTTAGTGSEVTHESVFKIDGKKKAFVDKKLTPDVAIVDPELSLSMSPRLTVTTGMDALAHAVECYEAKGSNPISKTLALEASNIIKNNLRQAVNGDAEAMNNLSLGSLMAGIAFGNSGTTLGHALSYPLSNRGVPHGEAVAMVLPYALEFNGAGAGFVSEVKQMAELIETVWDEGWNIQGMAKEVIDDEKHLTNNPCRVTYEDILKIFEQIRDSFAVQ